MEKELVSGTAEEKELVSDMVMIITMIFKQLLIN
jgi:hypothetical protein